MFTNLKNQTTTGLLLLALTGSAALLFNPATAEAGRRVIQFRNDEKDKNGNPIDVDDLHIRIHNGGTIVFDNNATTPFNSERGRDGGKDHNLYNGTVPGGGTATVTITTNGDDVILDEWWWTLGGNARGNGDKVGQSKKDDGGAVLACYGGPAWGDGQILVSIGAMQNVFLTTPGAPPEITAMEFENFLGQFIGDNNFDYIQSRLVSPTEVLYTGNLQGDPTQNLMVEVLHPDSGQQFDFLPLEMFAGPDLAVYGLCPGFMDFEIVRATPFGPVAFVYAFKSGQTMIPQCEGTWVDLAKPKVAGIVNADANGTAYLGGNVPAAGCERVLVQGLDLESCQTTNIVSPGLDY